MNLGLLLSPGDSLTKQQQSGQLERLMTCYLKPYAGSFDKVFLFSYGDQGFRGQLPKGVKLIAKPWQKEFLKQTHVWRVFQAVGGLPILFTKQPAIVTYGYDYPGFALIEGKWITAILMKLMLPFVLNRAQKIIITTKDSLPLIKYWQSKVVVIPNGVDPNVFRPGGVRKPYLVLSVGRLVKQKNHKLLLETIAQSRFRDKIKLIIIGKGPLKKELSVKAKELKVNLEIIDNVPHSQLVGWYQKATIFALTSMTEGQSKVLLEALSCCCACLTTPFSGNPLGGIQINQLVGELDQLLVDTNRRKKVGDQGRAMIINDFNLPELVQQEINIIKACK